MAAQCCSDDEWTGRTIQEQTDEAARFAVMHETPVVEITEKSR